VGPTDNSSYGEATCCNPDVSESKSICVEESTDACANDLWCNSLDGYKVSLVLRC